MENLNVILSLMFFLGLGSSLLHYASSKKAQARAISKNASSLRKSNSVQKDY